MHGDAALLRALVAHTAPGTSYQKRRAELNGRCSG